MEYTGSKTIAKNTVFLYFRMALVILVGLYSTRVILNVLGVENYGIYNVAGSVVALFGFLNGALGNSSSRFITIELGKSRTGNRENLVNCFKTTKCIHAILSVIIVIIAETIGLWILYNKCEIPAERMSAALWVYQISIITTVLSITLVPYRATIIAHEKMSIYAYVGIFEAIAKLLICFLIGISPMDTLVFYALLILGVQVVNNLFNRWYCTKYFKECKHGYSLDASFFKPILSYTGWNLVGSFSYMAITQASTVMVSVFFGPAIVAARAIAVQVRNQIVSFMDNFRVAVNPQIMKRHAAGDDGSSKKLVLLSTSISFYLMLLVLLPFLFETDFILKLWLETVPEYAVEFTRITVAEIITCVYGSSFYIIFQTYGRLRENALICSAMDILSMVIVFFVYSIGGTVLAIAWTILVISFIQGLIVKPLLAIRYFNYQTRDFINVIIRNLMVLGSSCILPVYLYMYCNDTISEKIILMSLSIVSVLFCTLLFGFDKTERKRISAYAMAFVNKAKIHR